MLSTMLVLFCILYKQAFERKPLESKYILKIKITFLAESYNLLKAEVFSGK